MIPLYHYKVIDSTQTRAKELAREGAPHGTAVLADRQNAGRGRTGNTFLSPEGGLYLSILLRPEASLLHASEVTTLAAVRVCEVLEHLDPTLSPKIKWVNDLFLHGRKICGILTEGLLSPEGTLEAVILGIGLNLYTPKEAWGPELASVAGAVYSSREAAPFSIGELAEELIKELRQTAFSGSWEHIGAYRERCFLIGERVRFVREGQEMIAAVEGISDDGALMVRTEENEILALRDGEVSVRIRT